MPACAKRIELLADLPRTATARLTLELAAGHGANDQQFVVLRSYRREATGEWRQRKAMAILRDELRHVANALLRVAR